MAEYSAEVPLFGSREAGEGTVAKGRAGQAWGGGMGLVRGEKKKKIFCRLRGFTGGFG